MAIRLFSCLVALALFVGCGSDVAGGVTIADAREECNLLEIIGTGEPASESLLDALFIQAEAFRDDDGISASTYINSKSSGCFDNPSNEVVNQCLACVAAVAAAVWP